jgi:hypothetical protein
MTGGCSVPGRTPDTTPSNPFSTPREIGDKRAALRPWHCLGHQLGVEGPWIPSAHSGDSARRGLRERGKPVAAAR